MSLLDRIRGPRVPDAPPPAAPPLLGLNIGPVAEALPWLRDAGIRHVRFACYWHNMLDPRKHAHLGNRTVEQDFVAQVKLALANGLAPLLVVHTTPDDDPYGEGMPTFVASVAARFPTTVAFQLHNEMNVVGSDYLPRLRGRTERERGASYARLFLRTQSALRDRGLAHPLVVGGVAGDPRPFLGALAEAKVAPTAIACHCYGDVVHAALARSREAREIYATTPLWLTEVGSERGMRDDARQARDLEQTTAALRGAPGLVQRVYWYSLNADRGFELVSPSGRARPAWRAIVAAARQGS